MVLIYVTNGVNTCFPSPYSSNFAYYQMFGNCLIKFSFQNVLSSYSTVKIHNFFITLKKCFK